LAAARLGKPERKPFVEPNERRRRSAMCANCGCGIPEDNHGDDRNIRWSAIVAAAEANEMPASEAVRNMQQMAEQQG
jgi:hypothetical protein